MHIILNNVPYTVADNITLLEIISPWVSSQASFALAINDVFVPKTAYSDKVLKNLDRIDIIIPMQGG